MNQAITTAVGIQWIADFTECKCNLKLLENAADLQAETSAIVETSGLKIMGRTFHQFEPAGATGLFLLAESHLAIHTWPEFAGVAIDLYVCNVDEDNSEKAAWVFKKLVDIFEPERLKHQVIHRGGSD